eukprot:gene17248-17438_t
MKRVIFALICFLIFSGSVFSQNIKVAAAANLQAVIKVLQADFKKKTGIEIEPIVGSSGNLVAQIKNGAPFDVFLSADMSFPETLYKDGLSKKSPIVYAQGSLIICSNQDVGFENWERVLLTHRVQKIAIANPAIAPYGKAADEALKSKGILNDVKSKVVTGESISQVNTYITTGVADVGFTTQALVKDPEAIITMPLVLPPSVLGFYLLLAFSPQHGVGKWLQNTFNLQFVFSFEGLILASVIYSMPFMLGPIKSALQQLPVSLSQASYSLGKSKWQTFVHVLLPNIKPSLFTAAVLTFAHTLGEFGVVLMI